MNGPSDRVVDRWRPGFVVAQVFRFAWLQLQCCLFAVAVFVGLAVSRLVALPGARYDVLLAYGLVLTLVCYLVRLETGREVAVIFGFHLIGLALELFKVQVGSWSYPEHAWSKVAGVPLYSGFMYAAVGSYLCQAFRRFDLRVDRFPWVPAVALAVAAYANFFTHHYCATAPRPSRRLTSSAQEPHLPTWTSCQNSGPDPDTAKRRAGWRRSRRPTGRSQ